MNKNILYCTLISLLVYGDIAYGSSKKRDHSVLDEDKTNHLINSFVNLNVYVQNGINNHKPDKDSITAVDGSDELSAGLISSRDDCKTVVHHYKAPDEDSQCGRSSAKTVDVDDNIFNVDFDSYLGQIDAVIAHEERIMKKSRQN